MCICSVSGWMFTYFPIILEVLISFEICSTFSKSIGMSFTGVSCSACVVVSVKASCVRQVATKLSCAKRFNPYQQPYLYMSDMEYAHGSHNDGVYPVSVSSVVSVYKRTRHLSLCGRECGAFAKGVL